MDGAALKAALKRHALATGLDLVGIASAAAFTAEREHLVRRREAGLGPNPFEHPEIDPRVEPDLLLPGTRSIIAAGISYLMPDAPADGRPKPGGPKPGEPDSGGPDSRDPFPRAPESDTSGLQPPPAGGPALRGWLSRYCRGQDYHQLLHQRLAQVAQWLEQQVPGSRTLVHVDTGPPLDRAVAERAGIGKFGKHTNLITPQFGTWVFLGEILTDIPLPPDEPVEASCGSCTLCLDICPTQCLTEWNLEANRCLSYVTQMKGIIPEEFRETMGNRLFGCDDCQDVCPYNKRARRGLHAEFAPVPEIGAEPDLLQLMQMTKGDFRRWFLPTAAGWRGKTTIQRNALIALGNSGDPDALPSLTAGLQSESEVLRAHAAWGLGRVAHQSPAVAGDARTALAARLRHEPAPAVQLEIRTALESLNEIV